MLSASLGEWRLPIVRNKCTEIVNHILFVCWNECSRCSYIIPKICIHLWTIICRWLYLLIFIDALWLFYSLTGIFFDTYGEYYDDLREFHQHLPKLLKPGGIYSYFNGLCGGNAFFHVVYCQLVALELGNLGYSTQFIPLPVKDCLANDVWEGVKHKYWQLDTYYLPVCQESCDSDWRGYKLN